MAAQSPDDIKSPDDIIRESLPAWQQDSQGRYVIAAPEGSQSPLFRALHNNNLSIGMRSDSNGTFLVLSPETYGTINTRFGSSSPIAMQQAEAGSAPNALASERSPPYQAPPKPAPGASTEDMIRQRVNVRNDGILVRLDGLTEPQADAVLNNLRGKFLNPQLGINNQLGQVAIIDHVKAPLFERSYGVSLPAAPPGARPVSSLPTGADDPDQVIKNIRWEDKSLESVSTDRQGNVIKSDPSYNVETPPLRPEIANQVRQALADKGIKSEYIVIEHGGLITEGEDHVVRVGDEWGRRDLVAMGALPDQPLRQSISVDHFAPEPPEIRPPEDPEVVAARLNILQETGEAKWTVETRATSDNPDHARAFYTRAEIDTNAMSFAQRKDFINALREEGISFDIKGTKISTIKDGVDQLARAGAKLQIDDSVTPLAKKRLENMQPAPEAKPPTPSNASASNPRTDAAWEVDGSKATLDMGGMKAEERGALFTAIDGSGIKYSNDGKVLTVEGADAGALKKVTGYDHFDTPARAGARASTLGFSEEPLLAPEPAAPYVPPDEATRIVTREISPGFDERVSLVVDGQQGPQGTLPDAPIADFDKVTLGTDTPPPALGTAEDVHASTPETSPATGGSVINQKGVAAGGIAIATYGLYNSIQEGDGTGIAISTTNLAVSGASLVLDAGSAALTKANLGVMVVDGVYQISKEDTLEHAAERAAAVGAVTGTGIIAGSAATAGVTALAGTGAVSTAATLAGTGAVIAAPVAAAIGAGYVANTSIASLRAYEGDYAELDKMNRDNSEAFKVGDGNRADASGAPSMSNYSNLTGFALDEIRRQGITAPLSKFESTDYSDPAKLADLERKIDLHIAAQKKEIEENSSVLPDWARGGSASVQSKSAAEGKLAPLQAAKEELDLYKRDLAAYDAGKTNAPAAQQTATTTQTSVSTDPDKPALTASSDPGNGMSMAGEDPTTKYYAAQSKAPDMKGAFDVAAAKPPGPDLAAEALPAHKSQISLTG